MDIVLRTIINHSTGKVIHEIQRTYEDGYTRIIEQEVEQPGLNEVDGTLELQHDLDFDKVELDKPKPFVKPEVIPSIDLVIEE